MVLAHEEDEHTLSESEIVPLYNALKGRFRERDQRMEQVARVIRGDFAVLDPNGEPIESKSPNLIQVALEDTAEAAGTLPTLRVSPAKAGTTARNRAARMERIGIGYLDHSHSELLLPRTVMDMAAFGFGAWVVWPDYENRLPLIERLDPTCVYPDPDMRQDQTLRRAMVSRKVRFGQLPMEYQRRLADFVDANDRLRHQEIHEVVLAEFWTCHDYTCAALFDAPGPTSVGNNEYFPVVLDQWHHGLDVCPVVYAGRFSLDGEARGQFDQVLGPLEAHIRLMGLILDYADQSVYSDIWVKDLIGELSYGGGAFIELGPNGAIGRVPPAVNSLNVQQDVERLIDAIHVGGRWPKSRPGQIDQSIASAKFVEATAGMLNTALKTYHMLLKRMLERGLRISFEVDKKFFPGRKSISGVLRNQEFVEEYETSDIDLRNRVRVEYGLGLGRDPGQSAVLMLQYAQNGYISHDFVQENIEGVVDVERERVRLDVQKLRQMMFAKLMQGVEQGTIPDSALVDITKARESGQDLTQLFQKYVVEPQQEAPMSGIAPAGIPGLPPPGAPPGGPPGAPPGAPGQAPGGPMPPAAPDPVQLLARLGVPAGPGGLLGSQMMSGGDGG